MHPSFSASGSKHPDAWLYTVLGDQNFEQQRGFFPWWYRLTSPPDAGPGASLQQRDRLRRSRLASALMLFLLTVLLLAGTIGAIGSNRTILAVCTTMFVTILLSIPLNRQGWVEVVGLIMCLGLTGGMYTSILLAPGGMSPNDKDILYLLFFSDLFVAAILPVNWVFVVALLNVLFSLFALAFWHHTPALNALLATSASIILFRLIQIHLIVSGVTWILVNNLKAAVQRADRAEEIAKLQQDVAELASQQASEKAALEQSLSLLIEVHMRVANGDLSARVPLTQENRLWQIAGPLNTLLGRYQRARQAEQEQLALAQRMAQAHRLVQEAIRTALGQRVPIHLPMGHPLLDPLFQELNGKYIALPSHQENER